MGEKFRLPTEPAQGSTVIAAGVSYTRSNRVAGTSLTVDGWRATADGAPYSWAELFVKGNGVVEGYSNPAADIVRSLVDDPGTVDKVLAALVESPHVVTDDASIAAETLLTVGALWSPDMDVTEVVSFRDRDGDRWYPASSGSGNWRLTYDADIPENERTLARANELWGPLKVDELVS